MVRHGREAVERLEALPIHAYQLQQSTMTGIAASIRRAQKEYPLSISGELRRLDVDATGRNLAFQPSSSIVAFQMPRSRCSLRGSFIVNIDKIGVSAWSHRPHHCRA